MTYVAVSAIPEKGERPYASLGSPIPAVYLLGRHSNQQVHVQLDADTTDHQTEAAEYFEALAAAATKAATWCREKAGE